MAKKLKPAPLPNYTQSPNVFFDEWLLDIDSLSELKVVSIIIRYTFGWHCNAVLLTLADYQRFTGLTEPSVIDGLKRAMGRGIVERVLIGKQNYAYMLKVEGSTSKDVLDTSKESLGDYLLKVFSPTSKEFLEVPLKNFKRFEHSPYYIKEKETTFPRKKERRKKEKPSANSHKLLTFELTDKRREWAEEHTPEVAHLIEQEIVKMLDWCNDPDHPERARKIRATKSGVITDKRFHNWMFKAREFFMERPQKPKLQLPAAVPSSAERNRAALEKFKQEEGLV